MEDELQQLIRDILQDELAAIEVTRTNTQNYLRSASVRSFVRIEEISNTAFAASLTGILLTMRPGVLVAPVEASSRRKDSVSVNRDEVSVEVSPSNALAVT